MESKDLMELLRQQGHDLTTVTVVMEMNRLHQAEVDRLKGELRAVRKAQASTRRDRNREKKEQKKRALAQTRQEAKSRRMNRPYDEILVEQILLKLKAATEPYDYERICLLVWEVGKQRGHI